MTSKRFRFYYKLKSHITSEFVWLWYRDANGSVLNPDMQTLMCVVAWGNGRYRVCCILLNSCRVWSALIWWAFMHHHLIYMIPVVSQVLKLNKNPSVPYIKNHTNHVLFLISSSHLNNNIREILSVETDPKVSDLNLRLYLEFFFFVR